MSERTRATIGEDLEKFQENHSPWVAVVVGAGMGVFPGILAASHNLELFVGSTVAVTVMTAIHLDSSRRTLASLHEELKSIGVKPMSSDNGK